jgi:hypothetical protein
VGTPDLNEQPDENHVLGSPAVEPERSEGLEQVGGDDDAEEAEFGDDWGGERPTTIGYPIGDGGVNGVAVGGFFGAEAIDVKRQMDVSFRNA